MDSTFLTLDQQIINMLCLETKARSGVERSGPFDGKALPVLGHLSSAAIQFEDNIR